MSEEIAKNVAFKSDGDHGPESNSLGSKHVSRIKDLWDHAWSNPGTKIPVGELVACDICDQEWTDRPESGGFLLGSYAYCPECAIERLQHIEGHGEKHLVRAYCGAGESFADFVRRMR